MGSDVQGDFSCALMSAPDIFIPIKLLVKQKFHQSILRMHAVLCLFPYH